MRRWTLLPLIPALALIAGCDSAGPTTVVGFDGAVVFTYSGVNSGSFSATGPIPEEANEATSTWAAANATATSEMFVAASTPRTSSTRDLVGIFIQRNTVGTETIDDDCTFNCNGMDINIGLANAGSSFTSACWLTAGTIAITEKTAERVKGTFSGTGECMGFSGTGTGDFTVTNGSFDVPIVQEEDED